MKHSNYKASLDVFLSFVETDRDGNISVNKIFSEQCLAEWIRTRTREIKHPIQSFQRVLYAHIRSKDRRRPFPENIEKQILIELRKQDESNPWKFLHKGKQRRSKKRFKHIGFHEGKNLVVKKEANSLHLGLKSSLKPHDLFLHSFYTLPKHQTNSILQSALSRGIDLHSPSVRFQTNLVPNALDIRHDPQFLIFLNEEPQFYPEKVIGTIVMDQAWIVTAEDNVSRSLLGYSVIGMSYFELESCLSSSLRRIIFSFKVMEQRLQCWKRCFFTDASNNLQIALLRLSIEGETIKMTYQLVTDKYHLQLQKVNIAPLV